MSEGRPKNILLFFPCKLLLTTAYLPPITSCSFLCHGHSSLSSNFIIVSDQQTPPFKIKQKTLLLMTHLHIKRHIRKDILLSLKSINHFGNEQSKRNFSLNFTCFRKLVQGLRAASIQWKTCQVVCLGIPRTSQEVRNKQTRSKMIIVY